jgi:hypothetical protein
LHAHLRGWRDWRRRNLVDAAKQAGVTRIIAQSVAWAYVPGNSPADEHTPST